MKDELIITLPLPSGDGYTWTLASRLGDILREAQDLFGPRDKEFTILGTEFTATGPRVWYPGNGKDIAIQLGLDALESVPQALFQLSHEAIHCLFPTGANDANVLEEGLTTYFSAYYMKKAGFGDWYSNGENYKEAERLVKQLLAIDPTIIKKIRLLQPTISKVTPMDLIGANATISKELADKLCKPFK